VGKKPGYHIREMREFFDETEMAGTLTDDWEEERKGERMGD
jgi:hypothetical protein